MELLDPQSSKIPILHKAIRILDGCENISCLIDLKNSSSHREFLKNTGLLRFFFCQNTGLLQKSSNPDFFFFKTLSPKYPIVDN